jgi:hypothetical protein
MAGKFGVCTMDPPIRHTRGGSLVSQGFGAFMKRALNSSSDRRKQSFVSTTDFVLPTGS